MVYEAVYVLLHVIVYTDMEGIEMKVIAQFNQHVQEIQGKFVCIKASS